MSLYVVSYDISHPGRRRRVARILCGYGHRVQRSVFEVWVAPPELADLRREIGPLLDSKDAVDIFPIDERGSRRRLRWQESPDGWQPVLLR